MVQFTIAASGQVIASVLQNSTIGNARVENCIVQAVKRWEFPKPLGGGIVIVSYPFVLTPSGGVGRAVRARDRAARRDAERPIDEALATLAKGAGQRADRAHRVAARPAPAVERRGAGLDDRPARGRRFETRLLVARLLERAKRHRDAVRVLSGIGGRRATPAIAAELTRHRRPRGRGRGAPAREAPLTW